MPTQPQATGNDGYGVLRGGTLRRDPYYTNTRDPETGEYTRTFVIAAHQVNTNHNSPGIYLPRQDVNPGETWKFNFTAFVRDAGAVTNPEVRIEVDRYSLSETYLGHVDGEWFDMFENLPPNSAVGGIIYPEIEVTVPANVRHLNVLASMRCTHPVNAWAIWDVQYLKLS